MPNIYHYNTDYRKDKKHPIYISPLKTWKKMPKPPEIEPIPFGLLTNCSAYYIDQTTHKNTSGNFPGPGKTNLENLEWGLPLGNTGIYVPRDKDKLLITSGAKCSHKIFIKCSKELMDYMIVCNNIYQKMLENINYNINLTAIL